jgi:hypothetical protein
MEIRSAEPDERSQVETVVASAFGEEPGGPV